MNLNVYKTGGDLKLMGRKQRTVGWVGSRTNSCIAAGIYDELKSEGEVDFYCSWNASDGAKKFQTQRVSVLVLEPLTASGDNPEIRALYGRGNSDDVSLGVGRYLVEKWKEPGSANCDTPVIVMDNCDSSTAVEHERQYRALGVCEYLVMGTEHGSLLPSKIEELLRS